MNQPDLFDNRDCTSSCTVQPVVRPSALSDEEEIDRLLQETPEDEIIECGWLRVANGYVGPALFTPRGKAIVPFWRDRDHQETNANLTGKQKPENGGSNV